MLSEHVSSPTSSSPLADAACVPHLGDGLVARWGEVFLVIEESSGPGAAALLQQCRGVADAGGDGRALSRRLAGLLTTHDEELPAFVAAAPVESGLAVFVHGAARVVVGDDFTVSGAESLTWVDRLIPWPVTTLAVTVGTPTVAAQGPFNLLRGVVPGAGLTLSRVDVEPPEGLEEAAAEPAHDQPAAEPAASDEVPGEMAGEMAAEMADEMAAGMPGEVAAGDVALEEGDAPAPSHRAESPTPPPDRWPGEARRLPAFESVVLGPEAPAEDEEEDEPREPLPVVSEVSRRQSVSAGPVVRGVYCKNGHFDDPRALFCAVCGINMVQQTPVLTEGPRPPLGVLLLDDGSAFQLDSDYVLGREPTFDEDVRSGRLRGIVLGDDERTVSRAHARIELRQWDVVLIDNSSSNGTYVSQEGESMWTPLPPGTPHVLTSGSRIRLGSRTLAFNSFRGE